MDYRGYVAKLRSTALALGADPRFKTMVEIQRGFDAVDFADLQDSMREAGHDDFEIWSEFRGFHACANGFLFQWLFQEQDGTSPLTGSAQISGVQQIYLPEYAPADEVGILQGAAQTLDRISPDEAVSVRFAQGADSPYLEYLSDITGCYHPIRLDFATYLEVLLECRALYRWQEFFIRDPDYPFDRGRSEAFISALRSLFPDADASIFRIGGASE